MFFPLAEIFGHAPSDTSSEAVQARKTQSCKFRGPGQQCTKSAPSSSGEKDLLGVCSLNVKDPTTGSVSVEAVCPHRFRDSDVVFDELKSFLLPGYPRVDFVSETKVSSLPQENVVSRLGNVDWTACAVDEDGQLLDYGTVEFQSLYTSGGGVQNLFNTYMALENASDVDKIDVKFSPRPDYLSSGRKRLVPQLRSKGAAFVTAGKRQAVVISEGLYEKEFTASLKTVVPAQEADLLWLIVKIVPGEKLHIVNRVYTDYTTAMQELDGVAVADLQRFEESLRKKLVTNGK